MSRFRRLLARLRMLPREKRAVAMLEFGLTLPIFLVLVLTGAELTNYITTKMRLSQLALQLADNAARAGSGSQLSAKTLSEKQINDLLTGAGLQSGELDLYNRGRVILTDLEPVASPNTTAKYKIVWQRCKGAKTSHGSTYGTQGQTNLTGIGPAGRQAMAPDNGAAMFVEVYYEYQPLVQLSRAPTSNFTEIASMVVRDRRDLSQVYNAESATISTC